VNAAALSDFCFATERLELRPLCQADEALCCELYCDAETMRFIGPAMSIEQAKWSTQKALELMHSASPDRIFLSVRDRGASAIGIASVQHIDAACRTAELGLMLLPHARAHGYSREALVALASKAFELLPVDELWVEHSIPHTAAERLVRSAGFAPRHDPEREAQTGKRRWTVCRTRRD
jgi:RimJ/RimL family protein N-acetyltransferase